MANLKKVPVTVIEVTPVTVTVKYGPGIADVAILCGLCKPKATLNVGDTGTMSYRHTGSYGLWFWDETP